MPTNGLLFEQTLLALILVQFDFATKHSVQLLKRTLRKLFFAWDQ